MSSEQVALVRLPEVPTPFPVQAPYEVKSDLSRLTQDAFSPKIVIRDALEGHYLVEKLRVLSTPALNAFQASPEPSPDCALALDHVQKMLAADAQETPKSPESPQSLAAKALAFLQTQHHPVIRAMHQLALSVPDDVVLMRLHNERFYPELMHVCFPTGWDPAEKYSQDLSAVHEPVADGQRLIKATANLTSAMVNKGPFVRYVWTLAPAAQLSQHPAQKIKAAPSLNIEQVYFRCERQVTLPLPDLQRSCFLIRVFVAPLTQVANTEQRRSLLAEALRSMSDATVQYKGLGALIPPVLHWINLCQTKK